ncbi:MAG: hypothetical protein JWP31_1556 [Aeromicrobium sp.]|nr:hypothetical protein [Aeromicrobium sp.]
MRRITGALLGVTLAATLAACGDDTRAEPSSSSNLESSRLAGVTAAPQPPPKARFTRAVYARSKLQQSTLMLDLCRGPIAVDLGEDRPVLVAEHDYCGGSAWISRLDEGDAVKLSGHGVQSGTYVVTDLVVEQRGDAKIGDLPAADVVLQTCISPGEMVLVAADRFDPTVGS